MTPLPHNPPGPLQLALVWAAFALIGLGIYAPALNGAFVSDDYHYILNNPYVQDVNVAKILAILNPQSPVPLLVENYAPVHLLLHVFEWKAFGTHVTGYHVVNVLLHALAATLLVVLLIRSGIAPLLGVLGGAVFLVHPANTEAVAWISQLKSPASLVLALGALLAHPRRPVLATALFGLALFAKPLVAFALPVAVLLGWSRRPPANGGAGRFALDPSWRFPWLVAWAIVLGLFALIEVKAFWINSGAGVDLYPEWGERVRSNLAIAGRYLWMAISGTGLSTFHQPAATRPLDPVWLAAVAALLVLAWRTVDRVWKREPEGAFLSWALLAYLPVCGLLVPLSYPMADRYLYFILPGLIGAALLAAPAGAERLSRAFGPSRTLRGIAAALCVAMLVWFSFASFERAAVWATPARVMADSASHYPDGGVMTLSRAARAAQSGDNSEALIQLRIAQRRGYVRIDQLISDSAYDPIRDDPGFRALVSEMATAQLERLEANEAPSQLELFSIAFMYEARGEIGQAVAALERASAQGGPIDAVVEAKLKQLKSEPEPQSSPLTLPR